MRDPNRIDEAIDLLRELWKSNTDFRLTQLLWVVGVASSDNGDYTSADFFYQEDDKTIESLRLWVEKDKENDA